MPLLSFVESTFIKIPKNGERINLRKNKKIAMFPI